MEGQKVNNKDYPSFEELSQVDKKLSEIRAEHWINHDLFSLQWWFLIILLLVTLIAWWKIVDFKKLMEILLYGFLVLTLVHTLDDLGFELQLWSYDYQVFKIVPRLNAVDVVVTITYMFIYQFFPKWKAFLLAKISMAVVFSFVAEPILSWMGIYKMQNWKYIYSFPIYIIIGVLLKWTMEKIKLKQII
jgi:hypothetical protein